MSLDRNSVPIDDSDATYNSRTHRYVLTQDYILDLFNDNLDVLTGSSDNADALLKEVSRQVYRWMYNQIPNNTRIQLEYLIAKDTDYREAIIEAMAEQYRYARVTGGNLIAHQSGLNVESGTVISSEAINNMKVSLEVKQVLETMNMLNQIIHLHIDQDDIRADY